MQDHAAEQDLGRDKTLIGEAKADGRLVWNYITDRPGSYTFIMLMESLKTKAYELSMPLPDLRALWFGCVIED